MRKRINNKLLYLSGGGDENQSLPLDKFFFEKFKQSDKLLYVPVALRGHRLFDTANLWMEKLLAKHKKNLTFEVASDLKKYSPKELLKYKAIYIGGGNTWNLMKEMRSTKFFRKLADYIEKGGIVYGGSAGAIILGKRIDAQKDKKETKVANYNRTELLGKYSVTCHFKRNDLNTWKKWAVNNRSALICLTEETGLIIDEDKAKCVGSKRCTVINENGEVNTVAINTTFSIK